MIEAALGFLGVFLLAFMRIPLAVAMATVGLVGMALLRGWQPALASTSQVIFETGFAYVLSVIPLFVLMGNLVARAGMARELYTAANSFVGHRKGGLAMASVIASGGFGCICGSSIATAATMTRVAYPEMKRHGYKDTLATGAIAAGGTLGILIPPSTILVIYGIITETDIGKLFIAGILPGVVAIVCLCMAVVFVTWRDPSAGPRAGAGQDWDAVREAFADRIEGILSRHIKDFRAKVLAREAVWLRYAMLPYNYTIGFDNSQTGMPLMRLISAAALCTS